MRYILLLLLLLSASCTYYPYPAPNTVYANAFGEMEGDYMYTPQVRDDGTTHCCPNWRDHPHHYGTLPTCARPAAPISDNPVAVPGLVDSDEVAGLDRFLQQYRATHTPQVQQTPRWER